MGKTICTLVKKKLNEPRECLFKGLRSNISKNMYQHVALCFCCQYISEYEVTGYSPDPFNFFLSECMVGNDIAPKDKHSGVNENVDISGWPLIYPALIFLVLTTDLFIFKPKLAVICSEWSKHDPTV